MPKKKAVRKVSRSSRKATRVSRSSSKGFFQTHRNLRWIIPLFIVLFIALFLVHHFVDEASPDEGLFKEEIKSMLNLDSDDKVILTVTPTPQSDNSTITPFPTSSSSY